MVSTAKHIVLGDKGEDIAANHLVGLGYKILNTNWRYIHKEIDIIASKGEFLIIVEVKTRSTGLFDKPNDSVGKRKQEFLIDATQAYIDKYDVDLEVRFDIIYIIVSNDNHKIDHIIDAFAPEF